MTRYPYLLFDADNTLFDFDEANAHAFRAGATPSACPFSQELFDRYEVINNATWERFDRGELTKDERCSSAFTPSSPPRAFAASIQQRATASIWRALSNATYLMPHAAEVVAKLRETHHIHLITNAVEAVQRGRLGRSALAPYVEEAFISETAGAAKPSVEYFDYVFAHIDGITRENCLVIGD